MIYLILTRAGLDSIRTRMDFTRDVLWVSADVLTPDDKADFRDKGCNLSWFTHALDASDLASDIATIAEHHPGQAIWIEAVVE